MCCVLSWLQSLFLGLEIKTGPHPAQSSCSGCSHRRGRASARRGSLGSPAQPHSLCVTPRILHGPFLGASLGWAVCSRMELQAQSIVHSPSYTGPRAWGGAASVTSGKGKLLPSLSQQHLCQPCLAFGNTCVPTACPVLPGDSKLHENL